MAKKRRFIGSLRRELVLKSRESALTAIRVFNDPQVSFKSETFIVLMMIAWTYLLHAYYRGKGVEYRYFVQGPKRHIFDRTRHGAFKHWELERCLNDERSPVDRDTANNLRFLIGLRHEIEHQMTRSLDSYLSGRYQACAFNYNECLKKLFGRRLGIDQGKLIESSSSLIQRQTSRRQSTRSTGSRRKSSAQSSGRPMSLKP